MGEKNFYRLAALHYSRCFSLPRLLLTNLGIVLLLNFILIADKKPLINIKTLTAFFSKLITGQFMEFEFSKIFLLNSEKPKADLPNREFWKIVSWKARNTNSIFLILKMGKNEEFVILAFKDLIIQGVSKVFSFLFFFEKI